MHGLIVYTMKLKVVVRLMVYCELIKKGDNSAVYSIGRTADDMTGKIVFYKEMRKPVVIKQPEKRKLYDSIVDRLYVRYSTQMMEGVFDNNLSIEI